MKDMMKRYEEKCHDGKKKSVAFNGGSKKTRMLGRRIGRKEDLKSLEHTSSPQEDGRVGQKIESKEDHEYAAQYTLGEVKRPQSTSSV